MSSVSIIVPFFNEAQTLPLCLSSLRQQTMQDIEVILIDDGSTDTGREIAERYIKKTAHVLVRTPNKGQGYARNAGLQYVTSPFLTFVDADDILLPRACELLMEVSTMRTLFTGGMESLIILMNYFWSVIWLGF
jgi:CDP-glycerol glycerophosphotransferase